MDGRYGAPTTQVGSDNGADASIARGANPLFDRAPEPGSGAAPDPDPRPQGGPPRQRGRVLRVLGITGLVLVLLVVLFGAALYLSIERLSNNVTRVPDVFGALDSAERPSPLGNRVSFLVMGTDSRQTAVQRSDDVLMLARVDIDLNPERTRASVVSIPRDSWVDVPGHGPNRIRSAYGYGGPSLLVRTVEQLTKARIDHFATIDFAGFRDMVNAIGGIDLGANHLDGRSALDYVSAGSPAPAAYADRLARQQNALRALLDKAATSGLFADPIDFIRLLDAVSHAVSVDETLSNGKLQELGLQMRGLSPSGVQFLVCPTTGLGRENGQSVVHLDEVRSAELWDALRADTVGEFARRNRNLVAVPPR
jgi:anionic cell wall polymer biosynthesis LytR-Cps2A-Psr (LCP) family protein